MGGWLTFNVERENLLWKHNVHKLWHLQKGNVWNEGFSHHC